MSTRSNRKRVEMYFILTVFTLLLLPSCRVNAFSEQLEAAEEEQLVDERTLLDMFGEVAKEFFTQRLIPDTDEECRWDWRHARCEPNCSCGLEFKLGDYHLGRSCRNRVKTEAPAMCDIPPNTPYAKVFDVAVHQWRVLGEQTKMTASVVGTLAKYKYDDAIQQVCAEVSRDCDDGGHVQPRSFRTKLLCGHIPTCDETNEGANVFERAQSTSGEWLWT